MRTRHLVFLAFILADDIVLKVAALDLRSESRLNAAGSTADGVQQLHDVAESTTELAVQGEEERAFNWFPSRARAKELVSRIWNRPYRYTRLPTAMTDPDPDPVIPFEVLEKRVQEGIETSTRNFGILADLMGTKSDKDLVHLVHLVNFLHWLRSRPDMESHADQLQKLLIDWYDHPRKVLPEVWKQNEMTSKEVLDIVKSWKVERKMWLQFVELSRPEEGDSMYLKGALEDLLDAFPDEHYVRYGAFFQNMLEGTDLKEVAKSMQTELFAQHIAGEKTPEDTLNIAFSALFKSHELCEFRAFKAFTLQYAEAKGGKTLREEAEEAFAKAERGERIKAIQSFMKKCNIYHQKK
uniref:RxLR effector candidate protein n=1 Tax=Hyaloperonospora arabidopsidis (strain Emoy2) TaxID=559515 RepID=M4BW19_HYAAE